MCHLFNENFVGLQRVGPVYFSGMVVHQTPVSGLQWFEHFTAQKIYLLK